MNPAQLLSRFDRIGEVPEAIPRLRRFILDLAVRGKLVEQDPRDEPATELLKRIQSEKARRVKEGSLREQKPLPAIENDEIDYVLPPNWQWVRMGDVIKLWNGYAFKSGDFQSNGIPVIRIGDLQGGKVVLDGAVRISEAIADAVGPEFNIPNDALLIAMSGATTGKVAFNRTGVRLLLNQRVGRIEVFLMSPDFIRFFFETIVAKNLSISFGTAIPNLSAQQINQTIVPLPPLAEQHRIVAKVDELMALCDQLAAAQTERESRRDRLVASSLNGLNNGADADAFQEHARFYFNHLPRLTTRTDHIKQLRQTILNLAVRGKLVPQNPTDEPADDLLLRLRSEKLEKIRLGTLRKPRSNEAPFVPETDASLPVGWALGCVADFGAPEVNAVVDGPFGSNLKLSDYDPKGVYPVITISNIDEGFNLSTLRKVSEKKYQELKRSAVRANDILVAKIGSSYGKVGLYPAYMPVGIIPANLLKITPNPSLDWRFLVTVLRSPDFKAKLETIVQFTAQPAFGVSKFKLLAIAVPPLAEQHRIVAKVDELMALCDQLETQLTTNESESRHLLEGILHGALAKPKGKD